MPLYCPLCGLPVFMVAFDYGRCRETGYHDAGETPHCELHGMLDEGDLIEDAALAQALAAHHMEPPACDACGKDRLDMAQARSARQRAGDGSHAVCCVEGA